MLRKFCFVPDKIYRYAIRKSSVMPGSRYDSSSSRIQFLFASYATKINSYNKSDPDLVELKNDPISDVKLICSYLVEINNEYVYHVDDDFIFDIAYNSINKNGKLSGEYQFCSIGKDLKLLRVGSPLYNQVVGSERRRKLPKIRKKAFEPGGVYSTPSGNKSIFLGKIDTYNYLGFTNDPSKLYSPAQKNNLLFYDLFRYARFEDFNIDSIEDTSYLSIKKTTSFTEKVASINLDEDVISKIKKNLIKSLKSQIVEAYSTNNNAYYRSNNYIHYLLRRYGNLVNMVDSGKKLEAPLDMNKYLIYA